MFWVVFKIYLLLIVFVIYAISFVFRLRQRISVPAMDHRMQACFLTMTRQAKFAGEEHDTQTQDQRGKDLRHAKRLRELMNELRNSQSIVWNLRSAEQCKKLQNRSHFREFSARNLRRNQIYICGSQFLEGMKWPPKTSPVRKALPALIPAEGQNHQRQRQKKACLASA